MTTGAPIYLVSACTSGEEFVAAFRRYADRNGVIFVPIAEPLPAGKKARFALTLRDGGVMVEGDAEIVSSARTPSVLYGRVGMTVKFVSPDEPSKTLLGELEKARLALKPPAPSVAPRPADIPAEPRAKAPTPNGRIDAANALAECVAIGDLGPPSERTGAGTLPPLGAAPKFGVPSIPPRPATPAAGTPSVAKVGMSTTLGLKAIDKPPASPARPGSSTSPPPMPLPRPPTPSTGTPMVRQPTPSSGTPMPIPRQPTPSAGTPMATTLGMKPIEKPPAVTPAPPVVAPPRPAAPVREDEDEPTDLTSIPETPFPQVDDSIPQLAGVDDSTAPVAVVPEPAKKEKSGRETRRTVLGIAVVPEGVTVLPAAPAPRLSGEHEIHDTAVMEAQKPISAEIEAPVDPLGATKVAKHPTAENPIAKVVTPVVEEPTPSGDWTMIPGANGPTIEPRRPVKPIPKGPPTGDFIIALDPSRPDGWSEPSKVEKRPEQPTGGNPVLAVSSDKPLDSNKRAATVPPTDDGPKIQIDPTLIEPLPAMPALDADEAPAVGNGTGENAAIPTPAPVPADAFAPVPTSGFGPPPANAFGASPTNAFGPAPAASASFAPAASASFAPSASASTSLAPPRLFDPGENAGVGDSTALVSAARRKRTIVIVASAVAVVIAGIVAVVLLGGGDSDAPPRPKSSETSQPSGTPPTPVPEKQVVAPVVVDAAAAEEPVATGEDAAAEEHAAVAPVDAAPAEPAVVAPVATGPCTLSITSVPTGAEILLDKNVVGTTPAKLELPCGVESKLAFRKTRFVTATRSVTPAPEATKPLKVSLAKVTFSVKVSSSPAGATITVGGKMVGVTPTTVKLPAFEASMLKIAKDGFAPETQKITPKQNNQTVHAALKKQAARRR